MKITVEERNGYIAHSYVTKPEWYIESCERFIHVLIPMQAAYVIDGPAVSLPREHPIYYYCALFSSASLDITAFHEWWARCLSNAGCEIAERRARTNVLHNVEMTLIRLWNVNEMLERGFKFGKHLYKSHDLSSKEIILSRLSLYHGRSVITRPRHIGGEEAVNSLRTEPANVAASLAP